MSFSRAVNVTSALDTLHRALNFELFTLGDSTVTLATVLTIVLIVAASFWGSHVIRHAATRLMKRRGLKLEGPTASVLGLIHYAVLIVGVAVALETAGIQLATLFAAGAVFAVGIGFAMKTIAENFVSGVILLLERKIKPGDVLEVEGTMVRLQELGIRTALVRTRDGEEIIVPNSTLAQSSVKNYTMSTREFRIHAQVGVIYGSDMNVVLEALHRSVKAFEAALETPAPLIRMLGFGSSSVDFDVAVWIDSPWDEARLRSELHQGIWWTLKEAGVTIAFPQLDVHFDPQVSDGFAKLRSVG